MTLSDRFEKLEAQNRVAVKPGVCRTIDLAKARNGSLLYTQKRDKRPREAIKFPSALLLYSIPILALWLSVSAPGFAASRL